MKKKLLTILSMGMLLAILSGCGATDAAKVSEET